MTTFIFSDDVSEVVNVPSTEGILFAPNSDAEVSYRFVAADEAVYLNIDDQYLHAPDIDYLIDFLKAAKARLTA